MNNEYENLLKNSIPFDYKEFYDFVSPQFSSFVEVGSWQGDSIIYLTNQLLKLNKEDFQIFSVDLFENTTDEILINEYSNKINKIFELYKYNLKKHGVDKYITTIKDVSWQAAGQFEDESLDFVFIDASHDYESVKKDIKAWSPKIKKGGMISGHDYDDYWAGVKKAVDEAFGTSIKRLCHSVWYIYK